MILSPIIVTRNDCSMAYQELNQSGIVLNMLIFSNRVRLPVKYMDIFGAL